MVDYQTAVAFGFVILGLAIIVLLVLKLAMMDWTSTSEKKDLILLVASIASFVAIARLPYGFRRPLGWFICGAGLYAIHSSFQNKIKGWAWAFG